MADEEEPQQDNGFGLQRVVMIFLITQSMTRLLFGAPQTAPGAPIEEREPSDFEKWAKPKMPEQPHTVHIVRREARRRRRLLRHLGLGPFFKVGGLAFLDGLSRGGLRRAEQ